MADEMNVGGVSIDVTMDTKKAVADFKRLGIELKNESDEIESSLLQIGPVIEGLKNKLAKLNIGGSIDISGKMSDEVKETKAVLAELESAYKSLSNRKKELAKESAANSKAEAKAIKQLAKENTEAEKDRSKALNSSVNSVTQLRNALVGLLAVMGGRTIYDWVLGTPAELQRAERTFGILIQDQQKAKEVMDNLRDLAMKTPYTIADFSKTANVLAGTDLYVSNVEDLTARIGKLAMGNSDLLGQITKAVTDVVNAGKVQGEELRQLKNSGIPIIQEMADVMGVTVSEFRDLTSAGQVSADVLVTAIKRMTDAGGSYFEILDSYGDDYLGKLEQVKGKLLEVGIEIGGPAMQHLITYFDELLGKMEDPAFASVVEDWKEIFLHLTEAITDAIDLIADNPKISSAVVQLGALSLALSALTSVLKPLISIASSIPGLLSSIGATLGGTAISATEMTAGVAALETSTAGLATTAAATTPVLGSLAARFAAINPIIAAFVITAGSLLAIWKPMAKDLAGVNAVIDDYVDNMDKLALLGFGLKSDAIDKATLDGVKKSVEDIISIRDLLVKKETGTLSSLDATELEGKLLDFANKLPALYDKYSAAVESGMPESSALMDLLLNTDISSAVEEGYVIEGTRRVEDISKKIADKIASGNTKVTKANLIDIGFKEMDDIEYQAFIKKLKQYKIAAGEYYTSQGPRTKEGPSKQIKIAKPIDMSDVDDYLESMKSTVVDVRDLAIESGTIITEEFFEKLRDSAAANNMFTNGSLLIGAENLNFALGLTNEQLVQMRKNFDVIYGSTATGAANSVINDFFPPNYASTLSTDADQVSVSLEKIKSTTLAAADTLKSYLTSGQISLDEYLKLMGELKDKSANVFDPYIDNMSKMSDISKTTIASARGDVTGFLSTLASIPSSVVNALTSATANTLAVDTTLSDVQKEKLAAQYAAKVDDANKKTAAAEAAAAKLQELLNKKNKKSTSSGGSSKTSSTPIEKANKEFDLLNRKLNAGLLSMAQFEKQANTVRGRYLKKGSLDYIEFSKKVKDISNKAAADILNAQQEAASDSITILKHRANDIADHFKAYEAFKKREDAAVKAGVKTQKEANEAISANLWDLYDSEEKSSQKWIDNEKRKNTSSSISFESAYVRMIETLNKYKSEKIKTSKWLVEDEAEYLSKKANLQDKMEEERYSAIENALDKKKKLMDDAYASEQKAIEKKYDDQDKLVETEERDARLAELKTLETQFASSVTKEGKDRLKEIRAEMKDINDEIAKETRDKARDAELLTLENEYDTFSTKLETAYETIGKFADDTTLITDAVTALLTSLGIVGTLAGKTIPGVNDKPQSPPSNFTVNNNINNGADKEKVLDDINSWLKKDFMA